jgi:vanillate O-demethylase ferredoxin subunit
MTNGLLSVRVLSVRYEAEDINSYELVDPDGGELPPFTAGAHIDLHFRDGRIRQYSLCNDPAERHRYVVGILKDRAAAGLGCHFRRRCARAGSSPSRCRAITFRWPSVRSAICCSPRIGSRR